MTVTLDVPQLCRDFVIIVRDEALRQGLDQVSVLQAYRLLLCHEHAPMNHLLIEEIDRTLLAVAVPVPA